MKRLSVLIILVLLVGCGMSANQLEAERAYYQALTEIQKNAAARPLVEFVPADSGKPIVFENVARLTVYAPTPQNQELRQYVQTNYDEVWARALLGVTGIVAPMYGMIEVTKAVTGLATVGNTTYNVSGTANTVKPAGNTFMGGVTGNSNTVTAAGLIDHTSTPTVVTQPAPVIVEQPAPIIVEQPAPLVVTKP